MKNLSKVLLVSGLIIISITATGCSLFSQENKQQTNNPSAEIKQKKEKIYVGLEEDGAVAVLDVKSQKLIKKISLDSENGQEFMAHNIYVAPDGKSVWVAANSMEKTMHSFRLTPSASAKEMNENEGMSEKKKTDEENKSTKEDSELIIIDPLTDVVINRIPLGIGLGLAHIVLTPDSQTAIATSQKKDSIFIIDATTKEITKKINSEQGSQPHGISVTPDGNMAYVALLKGKGILEINLNNFESIPILINGGAAQTTVTPDGKKVIATLYDMKKLAIYNLEDKTIQEIPLPEGTKGPLQLYPTADSSTVYVTDQGYYFKQPKGEKIYKVNIQNSKVVAEITVGQAPHGIIISKDGAYIYVTNYSSNDVSVINANTDTEIAKIRVGKGPNGISLWSE